MGREGFEPSTLGLREPSDRLGLSRCVWVLQRNRALGAPRVSGCLVLSRCHFADTLADSDKLDGIDSTAFIKGTGRAEGQAVTVPPGLEQPLGPALLGFVQLLYFCPNPTTSNGNLTIVTLSGSPADVWIESGEPNPIYSLLLPGIPLFSPTFPIGDSFHIQVHRAFGVMTIEVATANRPADCIAQAQALLTS
jgi:hypothetical protein